MADEPPHPPRCGDVAEDSLGPWRGTAGLAAAAEELVRIERV